MNSDKPKNQIRRKSVITGAIASLCMLFGYYVYKKRNKYQSNTPKMIQIQNPMVAMVGITKYDGKKEPYVDLHGVTADTQKNINLWNGFFNYDINILTDDKKQKNDGNITLKKVQTFFNDIRYATTKKDYDSLICIISGHGHNDSLITSDKKCYKISSIKNYFNCKALPLLANKPKMFIIDICRNVSNKNMDFVLSNKEKSASYQSFGAENTIHPDSDISIIYSNTKSYKVPENDNGSAIMECLSNVMQSIDLSMNDLHNITVLLSDRVARMHAVQCVEFVSTNKHLIYFTKRLKEKGKIIKNGIICENDIPMHIVEDKFKASLRMITYVGVTLCIPLIVSSVYYYKHCWDLTKLNQCQTDDERHRIPSFMEFIMNDTYN